MAFLGIGRTKSLIFLVFFFEGQIGHFFLGIFPKPQRTMDLKFKYIFEQLKGSFMWIIEEYLMFGLK